jgi:hypothetical protein
MSMMRFPVDNSGKSQLALSLLVVLVLSSIVVGISVSGSRLLPEAYANPSDLTINTPITFGSLDGSASDDDGSVNGVLTVNGKLTIQNGGSITCNDGGVSGNSACPIKIVVGGNMEMQAGSAIYAENNNDGGNGGQITTEVGGNLTLRGTSGATPGAVISSSKTAGAGDTGVAGNISIKGTGANSRITLETGSKVLANGPGDAGTITITAGHSIAIDGLVSSNGSVGRGMPITIDAGCDLTISDTGTVSSRGKDPGADLVHLEGGCEVVIQGLVESTGPGHAPSTRLCTPPTHPDKPSFSTACVEVWAGNSLTINSTGVHKGEVNADTGQSGGATGIGWIDLFARGDINIIGDSAIPFAVHANGGIGVNTDNGGLVTVKSGEGKVSFLAIQADATTAGSSGGKITVEAKGDVSLNTARIFARGDFAAMGGYGKGGQVNVRSFTGTVSWQNGVGDVQPTGTGISSPGVITLQDCTSGSINKTGTSFPVTAGSATTPTELGDSCGGAPTLPDYVVLPVCECGTIIVEKQTNPDGAAGSFTFTGTASGTISDNGQIVVPNLHAGTYTSTENDPTPASFELTSISCDDGGSANPSSGDVGTRTATFKLDSSETVTCTFTDTKRGSIIVDKVTSPSADPQSFNFTTTGTGYNGFSLTDTSLANNQTLAPGSYSVAETVPSGWDLTSATCDDGSPVNAIDLGAGETVTCTFTDTKRGSIIIEKVSVGGVATFNFTSDIPDGSPSFNITTASGSTNQTTFSNLPSGTYHVTESGPDPPWNFTDLSCAPDQSISNRTATIDLHPGDSVTCTFTNEKPTGQPPGTIIIEKVSVGGVATFNFTSDIPDGSPSFNITTASGSTNQTTFSNLPSGTYHVTESGPSPPWTFTSLVCDSTSVPGQTATITLAAGETVTCTFTDTKLPKLTVVKKIVNDDGGTATLDSFTPLMVDGTTVVNGTATGFDPGTYTVSETLASGYAATFSGDCDASTHQVTLAAGDDKTCTITNDDVPAGQPPGQLTVIKRVINDEGGTLSARAFTIHVKVSGGRDVPGSPAPGSETGTQYTLDTGRYVVSEDIPPFSSYTRLRITGDCASDGTVTLNDGDVKTCTITNDDVRVTVKSKTPVKVADPEFSGVKVTVDRSSYATAFSLMLSGTHTFKAPSTVKINGITYRFARWEDGRGTVVSTQTSLTHSIQTSKTLYAIYTPPYYTLTLYVYDKTTRKPIAGATVQLQGTFVGVTDSRGKLVLRGVYAGTYELNIVTYARYTTTISVTKTTTYKAYLP